MKIKRYKKVNKHLNFYVNNFGFRQPYQVLLDGTFCFAALNNKINIADNIPRYLQGEVKLLTTQCAIIEMENLGPKLGGALIVLKKHAVHKCGHEGKPVPASHCLSSMLGKQNQNHYIVASQDRDLQSKIRNMVGVPLLYLHGKTPVLEQPSKASGDAVANRAGVSVLEQQMIEKLKSESGLGGNEGERPRKKKKKGPNPLSCKKKKNKAQEAGKVVKNVEVKNRVKKIRIPKHVKEILLGNKR